MFTSKKCILPVGISVALSSSENLNDLYIIATKTLPCAIADEAPISVAFP